MASSPEAARDGIPPELTRALAGDAQAQAAFDHLPPSHREEYVRWVAGAKREETRRRRAEQTVEKIRSSKRPGP